MTKAEILRSVWDSNYDGDENVVEVYVGYLRRKIDAPFGLATIETVRGVGYRLLEDQHSAPQSDPDSRSSGVVLVGGRAKGAGLQYFSSGASN